MRTRKRAYKNLLITGGAGFIGSAFVRTMCSTPSFEGMIVTVDALTYAGNLSNLSPILHHPQHRFIQGDIRNGALIDHLCEEYEIDTIVHFAAETHVDRSIANPREFLETNILGTQQLLDVVRKHPQIHFHHISTDEVYGALGAKGVFTEESPFLPNSPYAASKAAADHMVRSYGKTYGVSTCISHASNTFGPYQYPEKFIPVVLSRALKQESIPIYGKGLQVRDWLYVQDHVEAILSLLQFGRSGESYNVGGGVEKRNVDLVYMVLRLLSLKTGDRYEHLIAFVEDRPGHDFRYALDFEKVRRETGWRPKTVFMQALSETVDWTLHVPATYNPKPTGCLPIVEKHLRQNS